METAENRRDFSANQRPNETKTEKYLPFAGRYTTVTNDSTRAVSVQRWDCKLALEEE